MSQDEMASVTDWTVVTVTMTSMASPVSSVGGIRIGEFYQVTSSQKCETPVIFPLLDFRSFPTVWEP